MNGKDAQKMLSIILLCNDIIHRKVSMKTVAILCVVCVINYDLFTKQLFMRNMMRIDYYSIQQDDTSISFHQQPVTVPDLQIISINQSSTLANNIESITHVPSQAKVIVQLRHVRRCSKIVLRGRISGPSLLILRWQPVDIEKDQIVGLYDSTTEGTHFIEIIAERCEQIEFYDNFTDMCVEDPWHHRLTVSPSTIDITNATQIQNDELGRGWWASSEIGEDTPSTSLDSLYTRVQPNGCRENETKACLELTSLDRFIPYQFKWNTKTKAALSKDKIELLPPGEICLFGASHSRYMRDHMNEYWLKNITHLKASLRLARQPKLEPHAIRSFVKTCSKIVVGIGQWQAGYPYEQPTLYEDYRRQMETLVKNIVKVQKNNNTNNTDFYIRSMHYNPLGDMISACPPTDWRSPSVVEQYTNITKNLAATYNISYIDTNIVVSPVWDSQDDWCHFAGNTGMKAAIAEAQYVIGKLYNLI